MLACDLVLLADSTDVRREEEDLATFCYCYRWTSKAYETGFAKQTESVAFSRGEDTLRAFIQTFRFQQYLNNFGYHSDTISKMKLLSFWKQIVSVKQSIFSQPQMSAPLQIQLLWSFCDEVQYNINDWPMNSNGWLKLKTYLDINQLSVTFELFRLKVFLDLLGCCSWLWKSVSSKFYIRFTGLLHY